MLRQTFDIEQKFNKNATHTIFLVSLETSAFIPNVKKDYNDKFYCTVDGVNKVITLPQGGYEIKEYYKSLNLDENKIKIDLCLNTGRCIITLADNCSVDFTKENTFRNQLGFDSVILLKGLHYSQRIFNVQLSQKIFMDCNICKGAYFNGRSTQILYSFPNELKYGSFLNERPKFPRRKELLNKNFHEIVLYFYDENKNPVDFLNEPITEEILIEQC